MRKKVKFVAGFHPGGADGFGWCVAELSAPDKSVDLGVVNCADEAFHEVTKILAEQDVQLVAVGIGAPLWWTRKGNFRAADQYVKDQVENVEVMGVGALMGASLIQGFLIAKEIESKYPYCRITETHPRAFCEVFPNETKHLVHTSSPAPAQNARVSAWIAAQSISGAGKNLYNDETAAIYSFLKKPFYWWPK